MKQDKKPQPAAYDGLTQQEVADSLGITRTAVQQIEQRAYKKFKRVLAKRLKHISDLIGD
jgi:DNA-directed RNA polymerase sigma subunit (sigma70/sigma32)